MDIIMNLGGRHVQMPSLIRLCLLSDYDFSNTQMLEFPACIINYYCCLLAFLEQGLIVKDVQKLRARYMQTSQFKIDVVSLLPTDVLYLAFGTGWTVIFRLNRLLRIGRFLKVFIRALLFLLHPPNSAGVIEKCLELLI
jgi:hypothetical protein